MKSIAAMGNLFAALIVFLVEVAGPYWYGVFSGAWARHGAWSNNDPDTWIHSGTGFVSCIVLSAIVLEIWERASQIKMVNLAKGLRGR
jgi:hypothetical protein